MAGVPPLPAVAAGGLPWLGGTCALQAKAIKGGKIAERKRLVKAMEAVPAVVPLPRADTRRPCSTSA
jgi:hypothetical protein